MQAQSTSPVAPPSGFLWLQVLTAARVPIAMIFAVVALAAPDTLPWWAVGVVLLAGIETSDVLDGLLARKLGAVSRFGAMLDPLADSTSRLIVFWALAVDGRVIALVPLVMALRDVAVAYSRIVISSSGGSVAAKFAGKLKAVIQGGAGFVAWLGPVYWSLTGTVAIQVVSWIVILVTAYSSIAYVRNAVDVLRSGRTV